MLAIAGRGGPSLKIYSRNKRVDPSMGNVSLNDTYCSNTNLRKKHLMCRTNVKYRGRVEDIYWTYRNNSDGSYRVISDNDLGWIEDKSYYRSRSNSYYVASSVCSTSPAAQTGEFSCHYKYERNSDPVTKQIFVGNFLVRKFAICKIDIIHLSFLIWNDIIAVYRGGLVEVFLVWSNCVSLTLLYHLFFAQLLSVLTASSLETANLMMMATTSANANLETTLHLKSHASSFKNNRDENLTLD